MTIHDRQPDRPRLALLRSGAVDGADSTPARETWAVSVYDADGTDAFEHVYYLNQAEPEVYDSILYLRGGSLENVEFHLSLIMGDGLVWVAVVPVPSAAEDLDDDCPDLPPAYFLRHREQRSHTHNFAGGGDGRHEALRLTVAARCLSPAHGAGRASATDVPPVAC
jgi:hypothetical protein